MEKKVTTSLLSHRRGEEYLPSISGLEQEDGETRAFARGTKKEG